MSIKLSVTGLKEIDEVIKGMPLIMQDRVLKTAHADAAKVLVDVAQAIVPVRKGTLKKSIGVVRVSLKRAGVVGLVEVGPRRGGGNRGYHGHLIEFSKQNRDGSRSKAHPFMQPAFAQTQTQVQNQIAESLAKKLNAFMKRKLK